MPHTRLQLLALLALLWLPLAHGAKPEPPDQELRKRLILAMADQRGFDRFDAEVWLTDMSGRLAKRFPDQKERLELLRHIHTEARRAGLPPELVLAVIEVESAFDRFALSEAGARGLMQVMPFWLNEIGRPGDNLFHITTNLRMGCTILRYYLDQEHGDWMRALARYNGSLGRHEYPERVFAKLRTHWRVR